MSYIKHCRHCGRSIPESSEYCPYCGCKNSSFIKFVSKGFVFLFLFLFVGDYLLSNKKDPEREATKQVTTEQNKHQNQDEYEIQNNLIEYHSYNVAELIADLNQNERKAVLLHNDEYVSIKGRISEIQYSDLIDEVVINIETKDSSIFPPFSCFFKGKKLKDTTKEFNKGELVEIKGKISGVSGLLGYTLISHQIQLISIDDFGPYL